LSGDGTLRFIENQLRGLILNGSSTPGEAISSLNDLGIQFNRQGELEADIETLRSQLTSNFDDVVTMFSANTSNQSEFGEADRGLAGDLHRQLNDWMANDGIIQSRISSRETVVSRNESDLEDLNIQMEQVYERYLAQFIAMEQAVDNLNSLRDSLEVQFENLPFSNKRD
jgi:Flagellar capping protein